MQRRVYWESTAAYCAFILKKMEESIVSAQRIKKALEKIVGMI